jgi:L,D-transpeptidase catalytic domain
MGFLALIAALAVAASSNGENGVVEAFRVTVPLPQIQLKPPPDPIKGPSFPIAEVRPGHQVGLRSSPGGQVIARVGHRTEFGSARFFWIQRVRGSWLGVPTPELPDGQLAWIKDDRFALNISRNHFWITADLSERELELRYGNRVLDRFPVSVGSPGSPTPPGDYSITDALVGRGLGAWYGCCLLALSGHQPNLPPGWIGGDRMAIHGTNSTIGAANSSGCLRASDSDMVSLFARVPLGAPVFIRA